MVDIFFVRDDDPQIAVDTAIALRRKLGANGTIEIVPASQAPAFPPDDELLARFESNVKVAPEKARHAVSVLRKHLVPVLNGRSLLSTTKQDVRAAAEEVTSRCRWLRGRSTGCLTCAKGLFLTQTSELRPEAASAAAGQRPAFCNSSCAEFEKPLHRVPVFFEALQSFFRYYADLVPVNPVPVVEREFLDRRQVKERMNRRRCPVLEEMRKIASTPDLLNRTLSVVLGKTGRRIDAVSLFVWPDFDYVRGIATLERIRQEHIKKAGNGGTKLTKLSLPYAILDAETIRVLEAYKRLYWDVVVPRDANGEPLTQRVWLGSDGSPLSTEALSKRFEAAVKAAGLWHPPSHPDRITAHCARHFFTTILEERGAPGELVTRLRGDKLPGAKAYYEHYTPGYIAALREQYATYMPSFGL